MKELRPLKSYNITSVEGGKYIPILDRDPVMAAKSIVKRNLDKTYKLLKETFKEIEREEPVHEVLYETVMFSYENFMWFTAMFKELENMLRMNRMEIPYSKAPKNSQGEAPVVYPPFYVNKLKGKYVTHSYANLPKSNIPINNYRIQYIMEYYELSDFQGGRYPSWYLLSNTTIFEEYSEKTNTRVRVDFRDGEFYYFIAGASDNWQEITDVPIEMDHVISALIFRNWYQTDY